MDEDQMNDDNFNEEEDLPEGMHEVGEETDDEQEEGAGFKTEEEDGM